MEQQIESIMVFKELSELPSAFKHIPDYIPADRERVVVKEQTLQGSEVYLRVRFRGLFAVINSRHFRTINKDRLRSKLLAAPIKSASVEKLLKTL